MTGLGWNRGTHQRDIFDVVQNEQPVGMLRQPALDRTHSLLLILRLVFGKMEQRGQRCKLRLESLSGNSLYPHHSRVIVAVAIGIFKGELRLADATQSADGLDRWCSSMLNLKLGMEMRETFFATGEEGIASIGNMPEWGRYLASPLCWFLQGRDKTQLLRGDSKKCT